MEDRFKFRAWDTIRNQMITENDVIGNDCYFMPAIAFNGEFWAFDLDSSCNGGDPEGVYKVMQCTSLKDKNGKLIFEGDILSSFNSVIFFENGSFYSISPKYNHRMLLSQTLETLPCFVIGNIYQNPELIKGE